MIAIAALANIPAMPVMTMLCSIPAGSPLTSKSNPSEIALNVIRAAQTGAQIEMPITTKSRSDL
jgi:hypothetical protein